MKTKLGITAALAALLIAWGAPGRSQDGQLLTPLAGPSSVAADAAAFQEVEPAAEDVAQGELVAPDAGYFGGTALHMLDTPPVPSPYPGAELWAGRYGHEETLCPMVDRAAWASIDAAWLGRTKADNLLLANFVTAAQPALQTGDLAFGHEPGMRATYGTMWDCTPIEFTY
ncbi:MAG: hypothetical protein KDA41_07665, partial [Planctomycetales bacterium]|nr:hypothetical protein [Planctomycetales bacterium]